MGAIRLSSEPIIVMTFDDTRDERQVINLYMQTVKLAEVIDGPVYRVIDLREAPLPAGRVVTLLGEVVRGMAGAAVVPDLAMAFVGNGIPSAYQSFETVEAALDYARAQVAEPVR